MFSNNRIFNLFTGWFLYFCLNLVLASNGDRSPFYQNCVKSCTSANCTRDGVDFKKTAEVNQDIFSYLTQWSCKDECRYHCMWLTVHGFRERGYPTPKFHGKWPFIKIFGAQEPAAAFCSLLNLFAHVHMYVRLRKRYSKYNTPLTMFWHLFAWVCMNAWIWSTIFHTRDTPFTEFMDYTCALSMVVALFVAAIVRLFYGRTYTTSVILIATLVYYINHVSYLYTGRIDYGYNIAVNVVIGAVGSLLWTWWALYQRVRYSWRLLLFLGFSAVLLSLEILDFPPYADTWDAHALWHLTTAPLPLLFYRFVMDDLSHLQTSWPSLKSNIKLP